MFEEIIQKEIEDSKSVSTGTYKRNGQRQLYAKAPILLKFNKDESIQASSTPGLYVFMVVNVDLFTQSVTDIKIIEGKTLTALIIFALALIAVVFITFGISYEVSNLIFRPLKLLLRKLRNMQF